MSEVTPAIDSREEHVGLLEDGPAWIASASRPSGSEAWIPPVTQRVDPQFYVSLKGKQYATWPGVLDAATRMGLVSLIVTPLQLPSPDNGNTAVCLATAVFADGRRFEDLGDAAPNNTSAAMATALLRLASTRAKGRVLRDAINVGDPDTDEEPAAGDRKPAQPVQQRSGPNEPGRGQHASAGARDAATALLCCRKHAVPLREVEYEQSMQRFGKPLCPACYQQLSDHEAAQAAALEREYNHALKADEAALSRDLEPAQGFRPAPPPPVNLALDPSFTHACQECGKPLSRAEVQASQAQDRLLCEPHLKAFVTTTRIAHNPAV